MVVTNIGITSEPVSLHLGRAPIHLPRPVAEIARSVVGNRKGHATIGALSPPSCFATEINAAILAGTLGIHSDVAVAWKRLPVQFKAGGQGRDRTADLPLFRRTD